MIVQRDNFQDVIKLLTTDGTRSVDTETTGLRAYNLDKLFSIIVGDNKNTYYFNFNDRPDHLGELPLSEFILPREWLIKLQPVFLNTNSYWFLHNAKFDMAILARENLYIEGTIHCTLSGARIEYNSHLKYDLASCAHRIGQSKDEAVEAYIDENHLWDWEPTPKKTRTKKKYYDLVPFKIMAPYGERDARITYELGQSQLRTFARLSDSKGEQVFSIKKVFQNEQRLTKTCFKMEHTGILIDREYCEKAIVFEKRNLEMAEKEFRDITGHNLTNSGKALAAIFSKLGESFPQTEKGNPSFTESVLETFKSPAANAVKAYRKSEKRLNTYFQNFLYYSDPMGFVHASIKQAGTETGRFSYGDPNLQNIPQRGEAEKEFPVRRAFIPRENYFFAMLDFDQMEYRLMCDYAEEMELIGKILGGLDVHTACMELMGMTEREPAKTINFMLLYGGGIAKLAMSLFDTTLPLETLKAIGRTHVYKMSKYKEYEKHRKLVDALTPEEFSKNLDRLFKAKALMDNYFKTLPGVKKFIDKIQGEARNEGFITNWFGRRCYFKNKEFAYAAPNHLIQGGCADIVKIAMNQIDDFLRGKRSRMLVQIHDELLFEIHKDEADILPAIKQIMEKAYPYKHLPLTCGIDHSFKSWGDKVEGLPN